MYSPILLTATIVILSCSTCTDASPELMNKLVKEYQQNTQLRLSQQHGDCTKGNIHQRKEWGDLDDPTRLEYIQAIKCLHRLPSRIDPAKAPGARSRYDDFEAAHILNTKLIHFTGLFFAWHRWFVQLFETALREECGYSDYQPYWDWARWLDQPTEANPLYDGSPTSLSGNGKYIPNRNGTLQPFPIPVPDPPAICIAPGTGGGYIYQGPLVDWKLHLGPYFNQTVQNGIHVPRNPGPNGLGYNPRPIIRDFNNTLLQETNTYSFLTTMITNLTSIHTFEPTFFQTAHLAGHSFISGVDNDLFTSPGDPLFWFHHAQVDRIYSIWQALDFPSRQFALDGTLTLADVPPSRNATLDDLMAFEFSPDVPIKRGMSPTENGMCYLYE
ncbi:MAG: hypothetical protein LQ346_004119 [Caloplaca aetnensis]|nr:MAG: hypothetical protein LQ346_004119 [Caloplaca aetnensis]